MNWISRKKARNRLGVSEHVFNALAKSELLVSGLGKALIEELWGTGSRYPAGERPANVARARSQMGSGKEAAHRGRHRPAKGPLRLISHAFRNLLRSQPGLFIQSLRASFGKTRPGLKVALRGIGWGSLPRFGDECRQNCGVEVVLPFRQTPSKTRAILRML